MTKRIVLSLLLCAMVISFSFPSSSLAMTDEQKQINTRIDTLLSVYGTKRGDVDKKMRPEKVESEGCIYTYDQGLTKVNFQHNKKKGVPSHIDTVYYITADMPASNNLTMPLMQEVLGAKGFVMPIGNQLFMTKDSCHIIATFDNGKCKQIQFVTAS